MIRQLVWLDLCSGLGGASQPALDRGWRVIRVDIDPRFKPDIVADVRALPLKPFHVDVLWASPPCQEFSKHYLPWYSGKLPEPSLEIVSACLDYIRASSPRFWIIENVRGSRKWLTPLLGPTRFNSTGHILWGQLPGLLPNIESHKGKWGNLDPSGKHREQWFAERRERGNYGPPIRTGHNGITAAEAAKIPYEIGEAICRAVEARQ